MITSFISVLEIKLFKVGSLFSSKINLGFHSFIN
nr:MAG TPA: hypothetical protein [Crassvirales sp.]